MSLFPLLLPQHGSQRGPLKTQVRSCSSSAQNPQWKNNQSPNGHPGPTDLTHIRPPTSFLQPTLSVPVPRLAHPHSACSRLPRCLWTLLLSAFSVTYLQRYLHSCTSSPTEHFSSWILHSDIYLLFPCLLRSSRENPSSMRAGSLFRSLLYPSNCDMFAHCVYTRSDN